jgi:hypothetical protein
MSRDKPYAETLNGQPESALGEATATSDVRAGRNNRLVAKQERCALRALESTARYRGF